MHLACCVFLVLSVAIFNKIFFSVVIIYTEGSNRAVEIELGGFFAARKQKGGICYGTQNHAEAADKNQRPYTQNLL